MKMNSFRIAVASALLLVPVAAFARPMQARTRTQTVTNHTPVVRTMTVSTQHGK